jgi:hypothetical protein
MFVKLSGNTYAAYPSRTLRMLPYETRYFVLLPTYLQSNSFHSHHQDTHISQRPVINSMQFTNDGENLVETKYTYT